MEGPRFEQKALSHSTGNVEALVLNSMVAPDLSDVDGLVDVHLLGDTNTLLSGLKLGKHLDHMLAGPLGFQGTLLIRGVLHNSPDLVVVLLGALLEATACRGTKLPGLLGAA